MAFQYRITNDDEFSGAVIYLDGEPVTVSSDNPNYSQIVIALTSPSQDEDAIRALVAPADVAGAVLTKLSERVSYKGGKLYLDGDVLNTDLGAHIVQVVGEGGGEEAWKPLAAFLEKLSTNPSKNSRSQLWKFVQANRITIHEDGDLLLYKGLNADGTSISRGYGIVDGEEYGEYDEATNKITKSESLPNHPGAVVEIPRSMVDPDRATACSTGLHAGAHSYATWFSKGKLITAKINPRDVVSVPSDEQNRKVRVCRYVVFEEREEEYTNSTVYDQKPAPTPAVEPEQDENTVTFEESAPVEPFRFPNGNTVADQIIQDNPEAVVQPQTGVIPADAAEAEVYAAFASGLEAVPEDVQPLTGVVSPPEVDEGAPSPEEVYQAFAEAQEGDSESSTFGQYSIYPGEYPDTDEDDTELTDEQIRTNQKLEAYKVLIQSDLQPRGENLKRYRNKKVTAGRRTLFDQAVKELGLSY